MLRAFIVDDEPLARQRLRELLDELEGVETVGEAGAGRSAVPLIHQLQPDIVFLDVQMPVLDGFDVVDLLAPPRPHVVFVTAYDEYALRAFEVHALDYLTKPVRRPRLAQSVKRVAELVALRGAQGADPGLEALRHERRQRPLTRLALRLGRRLKVVALDEILYFEAEEKLTFAQLADARHAVDFTLKELEQRLDPTRFVRIHRAFIANIAQVRELIPYWGGYQLAIGDKTLPVSRRRLQAVRAALGH